MPLSLALPLVPVLIALNAFFVVAEYAVVAIRATEVDALRARGKRRAADAITALKSEPTSAIGAIQVCITMTNLLLGWIGEPAMSMLLLMAFAPLVVLAPATFSALSIALSFIVVTLLTVVFSELLPKALTLRYVTTAASLTAVPVRWIRVAVSPLVWLMNKMANIVAVPLRLGRVDESAEQRVTSDEIVALATRAAADGTVTPKERALVLNSLALGKRRAKQIMVPRVRVAHLDLKWSIEKNREILARTLHTRLPLCDGGMDHVRGFVRIKEALIAFAEGGDTAVLQLIAQRAVFVPETVTIDRMLDEFHTSRTQMLFLVNEHGGVEGIVTLADVLDELLRDEPALPTRS